jgi:outer membrane receptor protein involved in Fe transport
MGTVSYQHVFSPNVLGDFRGMIRDDSQDLRSNALSTPIIASQDNGFREGYFKGTISVHHGKQEWKAGIESDAVFLRERFSYTITDPAQFDPDTPPQFSFAEQRPDLEQSAFVQDLVRLGNWSVSAGLRWDHYQLLLNQNAVSPRLGIARYFPSADLVVHASYDRVFQTPDFENILLSSSPAVVSLSSQVLRLPVAPSRGNYYELGMTKSLLQKASLAVNYYDRSMGNFVDDDTFLNTSVGFPITFRKARIYGIESKLELPHWGHLSGFVSHSYMVGSAYLPVTGGLFLGDEASDALGDLSGRLWVASEERHTVRTRFMYQIVPRAWVALGGAYGSGLPVEFSAADPAAAEAQAIAQYGQAIADRVNFDTGRVRPSLSLDASVGLDLWKKDKATVRLQADVQNINNRINLINFAGLFSGNTLAPPRSYMIRLNTSF